MLRLHAKCRATLLGMRRHRAQARPWTLRIAILAALLSVAMTSAAEVATTDWVADSVAGRPVRVERRRHAAGSGATGARGLV